MADAVGEVTTVENMVEKVAVAWPGALLVAVASVVVLLAVVQVVDPVEQGVRGEESNIEPHNRCSRSQRYRRCTRRQHPRRRTCNT